MDWSWLLTTLGVEACGFPVFSFQKKKKKLPLPNLSEIYSYLASSISFDSYLQKRLQNETIVEFFKPFSEDFSSELSGLDFSLSQSKS